MQRRNLVKLFAATAVGSLPGFRYARRADRVTVVGGGIIGASIAYQLARRGAQVTLLEKTHPSSGATGNSFAWINATFSKLPYHYHRLNRLSMLAYRHLERELDGDLQVQWGGSLRWVRDVSAATRLREQVRRHQGWGYPVHLVDEDEFPKLENDVVPGAVAAAAHSEQEGSVDPVAATAALLQKAAELGARVEHPCEVTGLDLRWGRLRAVRTTCGDVETDAVVIAAGVDTPRVGAMAGLQVPLKDSAGLLAHTAPSSRMLGRVVLSPGGHMKQKLDGRIVAGASFGGSPVTETSAEQGERILDSVSRFLPRLEHAELERVTLGWRPLPQDDYPVVGFSPGAPDVYLAVTHSGVTLAPLIGRLAALEILDDARVELLEPYRVERFGAGRGASR
jgi:glycine/D-amino acid oxidase-like deaminating enzyme